MTKLPKPNKGQGLELCLHFYGWPVRIVRLMAYPVFWMAGHCGLRCASAHLYVPYKGRVGEMSGEGWV